VRLRINTDGDPPVVLVARTIRYAFFAPYMYGTMGGPVALNRRPEGSDPANGPGLLVALVVVCNATESTRHKDLDRLMKLWEPATGCRQQGFVSSLMKVPLRAWYLPLVGLRTFAGSWQRFAAVAAAATVCPLCSVNLGLS
jgi:hypothetical protein